MTAAREAWRRFGTPDAISLPALLVAFAAGLVGNFVTNSAPIGLALRLTILIAAGIAMWMPMFLCWLVLRREPTRSRPWAVAVALLVGLGLRALIIGYAFSALVGPEHAKWMERFVGALLNIGLAFFLSAVLVTAMRERRRQIDELKSVRARLTQSLDQTAAGFAERNEQVVEQVSQVFIDALGGLDTSDADRALAALQHTATEVVRPLSHELAATSPNFDPSEHPPVVEKTGWLEILDAAATGRPFRPIATTAIFGLELLAGAVAYPAGAWWMPIVAVVTAAQLDLINVPLSALLRGRTRATRISLVVAAALLCAVATGVATEVAIGAGPTGSNLAIGVGFFALLFSLGTVVFSAVARDRERVISELGASTDALERSLVRMRQAQWFQQKALSRALHGPIQVAVTAAALRLDAAMQQGQMTSVVIEQTRKELLDIIDVLHEPELSVSSLEKGFARISGLWDGVCSVSVEIGAAAEEHLVDDSMLRSCVIDIASEAVSNAVRHGRATHVNVVLEADGKEKRDLKLVVASDGRIRQTLDGRGLGTQLLDDCTLTWTGEVMDSRYRLVALLPTG